MDAEFKDPQEFPCPENDYGYPRTSAVLLSDEIEYYSKTHKMIYPFNPDHLKPAGYRLSLGEDYSIGGKLKRLYAEPGKDELIIPPFEVAIISTKETVNLPRFIIARWNLRVSLVYDGLLWTGALQVDPGWYGPLYCPIYNLSNEEIKLKLGDQIVLMDFVKTTPFKKGKSIEYPRPPQRKTLKDYNFRLKSALFTEAAQKLNVIDNRVNRVESLIGLMFASIAILFAALSILVTSRNISQTVPFPREFIIWISISMAISIASLFFTLFLRVKLDIKKTWVEMWARILIIACAAGLIILLIPAITKVILWTGICTWLR